MSDYAPGVNPESELNVDFHIMQNGKKVGKKVRMKRSVFIEYNAKPKTKWADMYEMIVADKAYISITDLDNVN